MCEDGKIKLLDFGAARVVGNTDDKTLSVVFKAGYAPVEQYSRSAKQGAYTDVYAASATIYKMLTGVTPPDSLSRTANDDDIRTVLSQSEIPQSLQEIILYGMEVNAVNRIQSAKDLFKLLKNEELQKDSPKILDSDKKPLTPTPPVKRIDAKKALQIALAGVMCAVLVFVGAWAIKTRRSPGNDDTNEISSFDKYYSVLKNYRSKRISSAAELGYEIETPIIKYAIKDINSDGTDELVIIERVIYSSGALSTDYDIGAIYTLNGNSPVELYFVGRHGSYSIRSDGYFIYSYHTLTIEKLVGTRLEAVAVSERISSDYDGTAFLTENGVSTEKMHFDYKVFDDADSTIENEALKVGSTFIFGSYEQDNNINNGKEDIEWRVLAKDGDKILVISEYALDSQQYNVEYTSVTWETCSLRKWLNNTFFKAAFSDAEQGMIKSTKVTADANPYYSTDPGNDTVDKVFLLSITEAEKYFSSDEDRACIPTAYAIANGAGLSDDTYTKGGKATCWWWLRSPGCDTNYAADIHMDGVTYCGGGRVNHNFITDGTGVGIRPALWIEI